MALKYVSLPLYPDTEYTYSIALQGNSYNLDFVYLERPQGYFFSLLDADSNPIVAGARLVPSYPMFFDYALPNLDGYFWLEEIADLVSEAYKVYPDKIDQYYQFFYIYDDGT